MPSRMFEIPHRTTNIPDQVVEFHVTVEDGVSLRFESGPFRGRGPIKIEEYGACAHSHLDLRMDANQAGALADRLAAFSTRLKGEEARLRKDIDNLIVAVNAVLCPAEKGGVIEEHNRDWARQTAERIASKRRGK